MNLSTNLMVPAPRLVCVELNPGPRTLSERKREKIATLIEDAGLGISETARTLKTTRQTVQKTMKKYAETKSVKNRPGQGRKRKLTPQNEIVVKKSTTGSRSIADSWKLQTPLLIGLSNGP